MTSRKGSALYPCCAQDLLESGLGRGSLGVTAAARALGLLRVLRGGCGACVHDPWGWVVALCSTISPDGKKFERFSRKPEPWPLCLK